MTQAGRKPHPLTARVIELARDGVPTRDIQTELGGHVSERTISRILRRARQEDPSFPLVGGGRPARHLTIPTQAMQALQRAAAARGTTPVEVARRILTNAAGGNLIDAVLDDEVSS